MMVYYCYCNSSNSRMKVSKLIFQRCHTTATRIRSNNTNPIVLSSSDSNSLTNTATTNSTRYYHHQLYNNKNNKFFFKSCDNHIQNPTNIKKMFFTTSSSAVSNSNNNTTPSLQKEQSIIPFLLPDIGEGIAEVEILKWCITPGDKISQFDDICQVQSDKATVDITSRYDGIVERLDGDVGDIISVGTPLFHVIVDDDDDDDDGDGGKEGRPKTLSNSNEKEDRLNIPSVTTTCPSLDDDASTTSDNSINRTKVLTSPAVRKLGKDNHIDLSTILGSGPNGRILKSDLLKLLHNNREDEDDINSTSSSQKQQQQQVVEISSTQEEEKDEDENEVVPIRGYNRLMIKTTTASLQIPHMVYSDEINVTSLISLKKSITTSKKQHELIDDTIKLTILPFIIKAASQALKKYPVINSTFNSESKNPSYMLHKDHNIGIAMDTTKGLAVPVIQKCQYKSIIDIAKELSRLQELAIQNMLSNVDIMNPTFSISNIGALGGGTYMSPIIIPPQVSIAAIGKIQRLPRFKNSEDESSSLEVEAVDCMNISIAADHRVMDGATLARFCECWKGFLEDPSFMMLNLK